MDTRNKEWYKSKLIWVNLAVTVLGAVATALPQVEGLPAWILSVVGVVNMALRAYTTQGVKLAVDKG